jgi:hypothetical protein
MRWEPSAKFNSAPATSAGFFLSGKLKEGTVVYPQTLLTVLPPYLPFAGTVTHGDAKVTAAVETKYEMAAKKRAYIPREK